MYTSAGNLRSAGSCVSILILQCLYIYPVSTIGFCTKSLSVRMFLWFSKGVLNIYSYMYSFISNKNRRLESKFCMLIFKQYGCVQLWSLLNLGSRDVHGITRTCTCMSWLNWILFFFLKHTQITKIVSQVQINPLNDSSFMQPYEEWIALIKPNEIFVKLLYSNN